jgi:hypothetical protein
MPKATRHCPTTSDEPEIKIIWEHVEDPQATELLRTAILMILGDSQMVTDEDSFDKTIREELN